MPEPKEHQPANLLFYRSRIPKQLLLQMQRWWNIEELLIYLKWNISLLT